MSDEYTVAGNFLAGKIDAAEYQRKMRRVREREEELDQIREQFGDKWDENADE